MDTGPRRLAFERTKTMSKIAIEVSEECEATSYPYWMIIDPRQNFKTNNQGVHNVAGMITGPFFSREEAERVLKRNRYNYGQGARVYCLSGTYTDQYRTATDQSKDKDNECR